MEKDERYRRFGDEGVAILQQLADKEEKHFREMQDLERAERKLRINSLKQAAVNQLRSEKRNVEGHDLYLAAMRETNAANASSIAANETMAAFFEKWDAFLSERFA